MAERIEYIRKRKPPLVLAFNEPDGKDQSDLTVEQVIRVWPYFESLRIPIASPAAVNPLDSWMEEFMSQVAKRNLRVDIIAVHSYGGTSVRSFMKLLQDVYSKYQRPILVTEFAVADWNARTVQENRYTPDQVLAFMQAVLPWMESQHWIIGYAWFSFSLTSAPGWSSSLFDSRGNMNALGRYYASFGRTKAKVLTV